jgi:hypothetical protein
MWLGINGALRICGAVVCLWVRKFTFSNRVSWYKPVVPATGEAETGGSI